MNIKNFTSLPFYLKLASVLLSLLAIGYIAILGKEILVPLIFSCLFSMLLLPLAAFFEKRLRFPRSAASMTSVIMLVIGIAFILYVVGTQVSNLASDWPQFAQQLDTSIDTLQDWISDTFQVTEAKQTGYVESARNKLLSSGSAVVGATVLSLSSVLLFLVFTFIYTFFFLLYRRLIMKFLESVFNEGNKGLVHDIIEQIQYIMRKYVVGLFIEMAIVMTGVSLAFFAAGIPYAFLLGLITGLFNIIPYVGIFTALLLSVVITFATATVTSKVFLVIIILVATHLIDSNVLLPVVVGSKVRINALITILGVVIGEMIWGISGMFLSIPVIAVLKIIFDRVESLKPWGLILGDDETREKRRSKKEALKPAKEG